LPYSYLANNNVELLEQSVSKIFDRELSADEKLFVVSSFIKYRNKQDAELLTDPLLYFNKIKYNALNSIKNIKERYDINEK
jgi:hypothetical protein